MIDENLNFCKRGEITSAYKFIYNGYCNELIAYSTFIKFVRFLYQ